MNDNVPPDFKFPCYWCGKRRRFQRRLKGPHWWCWLAWKRRMRLLRKADGNE